MADSIAPSEDNASIFISKEPNVNPLKSTLSEADSDDKRKRVS